MRAMRSDVKSFQKGGGFGNVDDSESGSSAMVLLKEVEVEVTACARGKMPVGHTQHFKHHGQQAIFKSTTRDWFPATMADVRALLRQQRTARRIEHPLASYSSGKLSCTVCNEVVRAESQWDSHLRSDGHRAAVDARKSASTASNSGKTSGQDTPSETTKRKLDDADADEDADAARKRTKADISPPPIRTPLRRTSSNTPSQGVELQIPSRPATPAASRSRSESSSYFTPVRSEPRPSSAAQVDEGEWAAFEADIAAASAPYDDAAVISAPAVPAEQEESTEQKEKVEVDIEDEKEEATRAMEDEFDEMQALEARVKKLKEQRDAIAIARHRPPTATTSTGTAKAAAEPDEPDDPDTSSDESDGFDFRFHK